jgi:polysaccharide biosynthesis/export protein
MLMHRSAWIVFVAFAAIAPASAQDDNRVAEKLAQYVRDARKAGLKLPQIRQTALSAGYSNAAVEAALADAVGSKAPTPPSAAATEKESSHATPPATAGAAADGGGTPASAAGQVVSGNDYQIGEGDVLQVSVWGEPTASVQSATVRPDGKISMPLLKDVPVAGFTPAQVEARVQEQLSKVIRAPDVTVIVAQINSKKVFLTGSVKKEGPLKYTYRMTVLQAISEAGGLTDYAKRSKIYVLHTENGRQFRLPFNYTAVLKGENMEQNILLSPGDTIVVP